MSIFDDLKNKGDNDKTLAVLAKEAVLQWPAQYSLLTDGLFITVTNKEGVSRQIWLCSPFLIVGELSNVSSGGTGVLVAFKTSRGQHKTILVPMTEIHGTGMGKLLADAGLRCDPSRATMDHLKSFFGRVKPKRIVTSVNVAGWHTVAGRRVFLRPDNSVFGAAPTTDTDRLHTILLQRGNSIEPPASEMVSYASSGTLEQWQDNVARPAIGNSRLVFMQSTAFAGALVRWAPTATGGIHLHGITSTGKTISMSASASAHGRPVDDTGTKRGGQIKAWNITAASLETLATENNDATTYLDEIAEMNPRDLKLSIYALLNGSGKRRSTASLGQRDTLRWSTLPVSTGEVPIADMLEEDGQTVPGGIEVRMLNVPADAGKGLGVLDHYMGYSGPGEFLDALQQSSSRFYGTAVPAFLEKIATALNSVEGEEGSARLKNLVQDYIDAFLKEALGGRQVSSQVRRSAATFALIATAGEIATRLNILPWPEGEATRAAVTCMNAWLEARGDAGDDTASSDDLRGVMGVRLAIAMWGDVRFHSLEDKAYGKSTEFKAEDNDGAVSTGSSSSSNQARWGYSRYKAEPVIDANGKPVMGQDGKPKFNTIRQYLIYPVVWRQQLKISTSRRTLISLMIEKGYLESANEPSRHDGTRLIKVDGKPQRFFVVNDSILSDD